LLEQVERLPRQAAVETSPTVFVSDTLQVTYDYDGVHAFSMVNNSSRYCMNLMPHRASLTIPPVFDDSRLTNRAAEMKVAAANCSYLFAVEAWFAVFNGCGELAYSHIHRQNSGISTFQPCLLLHGYIHVPFSVFSAKQLTFS
jgi:hypothetical protein